MKPQLPSLVFFVVSCLATGCSEPDHIKAYKSFASAYFNGEMGTALRQTEGEASQRLQNMTNPPPGQPYILPLKETVREVHSVNYDLLSQDLSNDGTAAALEVDIVAKVDRPGTVSVGGSDRARFHHSVHMKKVGDRWKIDKFEDREVTP